MKIYFSAWRKNGSKRTWLRPTTRRIRLALASDKYEKYDLRVTYGKSKCSQGCICEFDNRIIGNAEDIEWGLEAFI
jgi:hypothetical protein